MFRFTIRDVLWLTVVVAMGVFLWTELARLDRERASLRDEQAALQAKRRALDVKFLELVDATDRLNVQLQLAAGKGGP
jgi:hypothetical protein